MPAIRRLGAISLMLFATATSQSAHAFELTGAWASQADLCKMVFANKGSEIVFTELSDLYGSGFIIDGTRIRGKAVQCTINSRTQNGDNLELNASCATSIMTQNASFLLKVIDDNTIARVISEIENMQIEYSRCSL